MPRSGINGTYTLPGPQATQAPLTPIPSAVNNAGWSDVEQTFNTPTPIAYGGTNASTVLGAQQNLDLEPGVDIPTIAQFNTLATKVDTRRTRIVNGDKLVSQENAQTSGTTNGRYISDQNAMFFVSNNGVFTGVNVAGRTSPSGGNRDRITITTPDTVLAAGEFLTYTQNIEGSNVADMKWGSSGAVAGVIRLGMRYPAGTWPIAFHNSGATRSYVATFTVSALEANTDIVREFAIPGDTTGTYLTADGVIGWTIDRVIGAGSTFQGVAGWQAGNILTVAGATNGMAISGAIFEFFDEGMKADPASTGSYGQYEAAVVDPVYRSERYWEKSYDASSPPGTTSNSSSFSMRSGAGGLVGFAVSYKIPKCKISPSVTLYSPSTGTTGVVRNVNTSTDIAGSVPTTGSNTFEVDATTAAAAQLVRFHWTSNARLS